MYLQRQIIKIILFITVFGLVAFDSPLTSNFIHQMSVKSSQISAIIDSKSMVMTEIEDDNLLEFLSTPSRYEAIKISIFATGKTSGHIADAQIENTTKKTRTVNIPEGEIPGTNQILRPAHQGFYIPESTAIEVPPKTMVTVPLYGYCNNPSLKAPDSGAPLSHPSDWNTSYDAIQTVKKIVNAAQEFQNKGLISTPFSNDPEKERAIIVQQTVWTELIEGHNPCESIQQFLTGDPGGSSNQYTDYGVAQIIDAIQRVGRASEIESFTPPELPAEARSVQSPVPSNLPKVMKEIAIRVTGTGRTTGHIADLNVSNSNNHPVLIRLGTNELDETAGFLIPGTAKHQPYIVPSIPDILIGPNETVTTPIEGYCIDIRKPPVDSGDPMPSPSSWVGLPSSPPTIQQAPDGTPIVYVPTRTALPLEEAKDILLGDNGEPNAVLIRPWMPNEAITGLDCPDVIITPYPTFPGTDDPIAHMINPEEHLGVLVPVLLEAIDAIVRTTDAMQSSGQIRTPFSNNLPQEREAIIQQTFWVYSSAVSGTDYPKKEFESNTYEQFESATGQPVSDLPTSQKTEIDKGIDDFWNTFQAVGANAKVLPQPHQPISPTIDQENIWKSYEKRQPSIVETSPDIRPTDLGESKPDRTPRMVSDHTTPVSGAADDTVNEDIRGDDEEEEETSEDKPCKCENMTFDLIIRRVHPSDNDRAENLHDQEIVIEGISKTNKKDIDVKDWKQGDYYTISLMRGKMNCTCNNAGFAEAIDCDFYSRSKNINQKDKLRITEDPSKRKDVESLDNEQKDRASFKFKFNPVDPGSNVIEFCFSAYCYSKDCNISKSGVRCKDYCLELTFKEVE